MKNIGWAPSSRIGGTRSRAPGYRKDWRSDSTAGISLCSCRTTMSHLLEAITPVVSEEGEWSRSVQPPGARTAASTRGPPAQASLEHIVGRTLTEAELL